jgi:Polysaccharide deacetylase
LRDSPCFLNLSFDDTQAAHLEIANLLNQFGLKGTFYVTTLTIQNPDLINVYNSIASSGHEIGSHTVNHPDLTSISESEVNYEIDASVSTINSTLNTKCTSFAHPFHLTNGTINNIIFSKNLFTRNYSEYYSTERPRFGLTSDTNVNDVTNFINQQIINNGTCLIAGHGINGSGYSPSTTAFFIDLLTYVKSVQDNNNVWVTTLSNGALYESLFYEVSLTSQVDQSNRQIKIHFNYPNKAIYNNFNKLLFSFKINKSSSWSIQNSGIEYIESATQYIYTIDLKQTRDVTLQYIIN